MSLSLPYLHHVKDLRQLNYGDFQPFRIGVEGQELLAQRPLRLVRGRRLVVEGVWGGYTVVAKIFFHPRKAKLHFSQEFWGHEQLQSADVPVAHLLKASSIQGMPQVFVVIYKRLYPMKKLSHLFHESPDEVVWQYLSQVQSLLIQLYQYDLCQTDTHWGNFVLVHDTIYVLDYTTIRPCCTADAEIGNLAAFYANLPLNYSSFLEHLLQDYCYRRDVAQKDRLSSRVKHRLGRIRWHKAKRILATCTRASKGYRQQKTKCYWTVYDNSAITPALNKLLNEPERVLQNAPSSILKSGQTTTVIRVWLDGQWYVVKRYNVQGWWHFLTHCCRRSRAMKSWRNGILLDRFDIPTAKPLAMIEKRIMGLKAQNYVIMQALRGETLDQYLLSSQQPEPVLQQTVEVLKQLAALKIRHRDLKAPNFIVNNGAVFILDVDGMRIFRYNKHYKNVLKEELKRFRRNWRANPALLEVVDKALAQIKF